jgi:lipopolysaccharide assembly outer membrane protein LptD (OstA)
MKRLTLVVILACASAITVQAKPQSTATQEQAAQLTANAIQNANRDPGPTRFYITASKIVNEGLVIHYIGKVVILTNKDESVIEADEADVHSDTNEIEVRGHVIGRSVSASGQTTVITADKLLLRPRQSKP